MGVQVHYYNYDKKTHKKKRIITFLTEDWFTLSSVGCSHLFILLSNKKNHYHNCVISEPSLSNSFQSFQTAFYNPGKKKIKQKLPLQPFVSQFLRFLSLYFRFFELLFLQILKNKKKEREHKKNVRSETNAFCSKTKRKLFEFCIREDLVAPHTKKKYKNSPYLPVKLRTSVYSSNLSSIFSSCLAWETSCIIFLSNCFANSEDSIVRLKQKR